MLKQRRCWGHAMSSLFCFRKSEDVAEFCDFRGRGSQFKTIKLCLTGIIEVLPMAKMWRFCDVFAGDPLLYLFHAPLSYMKTGKLTTGGVPARRRVGATPEAERYSMRYGNS